MKLKRCISAVLLLCMVFAMLPGLVGASEGEVTPMYRLYNPNSGEHFYTGSTEERDDLVKVGWNYEGVAWNAPIYSGEPVYRVFNPNSGDHHYTMSWEEVENLVEVGWNYEGVCWNSASSEGSPQYRLYNPNADLGSHHYTSSVEERENLVSLGWILEGIGWFGTLPEGHEHNYASMVIAPACTAKGYTVWYCSCGQSYTTDETAAKGHSWSDWETTMEPTESANGEAKRICSDCKAEETKILSHVHSYGDWKKVWPTCTEDGYRCRTCVCGETERESTGASAYGHRYAITAEQDGKILYTCSRCGDSYADQTETRYDENLTPPEIESVYTEQSYVGINCYADFEEDSAYGYQGLLAKDPDFTTGLLEAKVNELWNRQPYAKLSYFYTSGRYYYKVRSYKLEGDTFVYGPWSEVAIAECMNFSKKLNGEAQYSYELYFLDGNTDIYSGVYKAIYIKTDNPNPCAIRLRNGDKSVVGGIQNWDCSQIYADIEYLSASDYDQLLHKVPGGYLGMLSIEEPGALTVEVREATVEGYVVAKTFQLNVMDYQTEQNKWIDNVISTQTDSSMNPKEKMDAIAAYLKNGEFRYLTNSGEVLLDLAAAPNSPWFVSKRWDSYTSPAVLKLIAERIGGFEEVHNCYADYPRGSAEWIEYHHQTYVVYNGEKYYYSVCPLTSTGEVGTVEKIDLSNTSQFIRIA